MAAFTSKHKTQPGVSLNQGTTEANHTQATEVSSLSVLFENILSSDSNPSLIIAKANVTLLSRIHL